jgi:hypothetical protein
MLRPRGFTRATQKSWPRTNSFGRVRRCCLQLDSQENNDPPSEKMKAPHLSFLFTIILQPLLYGCRRKKTGMRKTPQEIRFHRNRHPVRSLPYRNSFGSLRNPEGAQKLAPKQSPRPLPAPARQTLLRGGWRSRGGFLLITSWTETLHKTNSM